MLGEGHTVFTNHPEMIGDANFKMHFLGALILTSFFLLGDLPGVIILEL